MSISGIAGGIASRGVWEAGRHALSAAAHWRYAQLFGSDATSGRLHIVVGALVPPTCQDQAGKPYAFIFSKPGLQNVGFSTSVAIPSCEVRAAKYVAESVAVNTDRVAILTTDADIADKRDLSFVSFGIMSNLKTIQLLENSGNCFAKYHEGLFMAKMSGGVLARPSQENDYGLIVKVHPSNLPDRTWICCGGFGEWGTSGAAWYLTRKWKDIRSKFGRRPFVIIVRVRPASDESAEPILMADTAEEVERHIMP
jgi:hypothetical protein